MNRVTSKAFLAIRLHPSPSFQCAHGRINSLNYAYSVGFRRPFNHASGIGRSMHFPEISAALLFGALSYGAWYSYNIQPRDVTNANLVNSQATSTFGPEPPPGFGRKAVVVGPDTLYTSVIEGNEPISKETDESGTKTLEMMTPDQATQKLRRNQQSFFVGRGKGVIRYDIVQVPSNDPIEDDHSEKIIEMPHPSADTSAVPNPASDWMFWGVYDGHSGWTTSAKLRQVLINFVARELNFTYQTAAKENSFPPSNEAIEAAIKTGFTQLDNEIVHESAEKTFKSNSKIAAAELLAPALSGSCALLSFYDSSSKLLRVACTGDSRAILGRRGEAGMWTALPLSTDQTGSNPSEEARMRKEHPREENVIRNGRVLGGLEPTRAFGDASYKWSREVSERLKASFFGRSPSKLLQTPPYVTAEPVVTTTQIHPEKGDFVVMATDGLWEMLSNEEVVGLVAEWIEKQASTSKGTSWIRKLTRSQESGHLVQKVKTSDQAFDGQKAPIRQKQWGVTGERERFVVQDKNVATHLVRNALGGKDSEMVCALLSLPAPYSRRYRDDLTVEVIFFGTEDTSSGNVALNQDASTAATEARAKL
ncbi:Protein phosphatase 2C [Podosphaera aphanis]|nr:Protein phosphatase 2C [Podosphaera aphanis]